MILSTFEKHFRLQLPFCKDGVYWNGRVDEFNNIGYGLGFSQTYGDTFFSRTGIYGYKGDKPNIHNGHDYAGPPNTPLTAPCKMYITYVGYDEDGYGNFLFGETETITENGETFKLEIVLAHFKNITVKANKWVDMGTPLGGMGTTGLSTGWHTHFGVRPLVMKGNNFIHLLDNTDGRRGYADPQLFLDVEPIEDKAKLLKYMRLIQMDGDSNVYAVDKYGRANLIINYSSYQAGLIVGLWEDKINHVDTIPEKGQIIILTKDN
jgi:murein DD-endopeptidase MepM/ murein hydrolase activator NlpD